MQLYLQLPRIIKPAMFSSQVREITNPKQGYKLHVRTENKTRDVNQDIMFNLLILIESKAYVELEQVAIGLIMANLEYKFIKEMLEKNCNKKTVRKFGDR